MSISPYKNIDKRKKPEQKRAKENVERIFTATKQLIDEIGIDKISTNKIAEAAKISTGALYNFFPNKESILYAIANSWLENLRESYAQASPEKQGFTSPFEWIDNIALENIKQYQQSPLIAKYYNALTLIPDLRKLDTDHDNEVAKILMDGQLYFAPNLNNEQARANALTIVQIIHGILTNAAVQKPDIAKSMQKNVRYSLANLVSKFLL
jgi:AcrR family transcriptional regulator